MLNIIILGLISFFADISAEMVYPIIPLYLSSVFGATPALIGVIEGLAESTAALLKVFSGYLTDKYNKKKPIAFIGYAAGLVYKLALVLALSWVGILAARVLDRIGKGIRTTPRDVMVSESSAQDALGKSFGIHKALDMAGTALGILLAYFLLMSMSTTQIDYKLIFTLSALPAVVSLLLFYFVKEKPRSGLSRTREKFWKNMGQLDGRLKLYLLIVFIFTLGNSSNAFLLLRAKSVGFSQTNVILLYFVYSVSASLLAIPFGRLSDKLGRKTILTIGYVLFSLVYFALAFARSKSLFVIIFIVYGVYTAMTAGVERALIAEIAPFQLKGTMLGLHSSIVGIALLPASMICGFLWDRFGPEVSFVFGAALALLSVLILLIFFKPQAKQPA